VSPGDEALRREIHDYIRATRWATLATVREDQTPVLRVMGSFAPDGLNVYFSTARAAAKVGHIAANPRVNFYFQHEGQEPAQFKYVAVIGTASEVTDPDELQNAVALLCAKSPRFAKRAAEGRLDDSAIYRLQSREIKYLNCTNAPEDGRITELRL
jgi:nitroimidazol reductase NimA-like FMN-containing flavoprotein (pyridoxamine 5'-phosphate oxidase superfamily)